MSKKLRITLFKFIDILVIFTMVSASPMSMVSAATAQDASAALATDKADYAPGESAHVTGSGFAAGEYVLAAQGPDGQADWGTVSADATGGFESDSPALGSEGNYELRAYASGWNGDWEETPVSSANFTVTAPPEPTATPTEEPTAEPTATDTPTEEPTQEPTNTPTEEPTVEPSNTPTEEPTAEPTNTPTEEPTVEPTSEPTNTPTEQPTQAPTDVPTDTPTTEPTATQAPTDTPTSEPTATPTSEPTSTPTPNGPPTIVSDKADYIAGERVTLTGENWQGDLTVRIIVNDDIGQAWRRDVTVSVALEGTISDSFNLPSFFVANYSVTATGQQTGRVATTWFTDTNVGLYDQCANDDGDGYASGDTGCQWTNGNLQSNNSTYAEGDATVQRLWLNDMVPGSTHTVRLKYGTTKGGKHAYDYLTTWNYSENWIADADLCQDIDANGNAAGGSCTLWGADDLFPIPVDPNPAFTTDGVPQPAGRNFTMRNGDITAASTPSVISGTYAGDSETVITITFTVGSDPDACVTKSGVTTCSVVLWFGAHVALTSEWETGGGAGGISGSPYHVALDALDGVAVGQRDNQMQAGTVIPNGTIVIVKDAIPNSAQDFSFNLTNGTTVNLNFSLDDDADPTLPNSQSSSVPPGTYTAQELNIPAGWTLTNLVCTDPTNNTTVSVGTATASINLASAETVTCTFTDTNAGRIIVDKVTNPSGDSQSFSFDAVGGTYADFSLTDAAAPNNQALSPGNYSVSETVPSGWDLTSSTCTSSIGDTETPATIELDAGETVTCTFTNTKQNPALTLAKTATPTTYDSVGDVINYSYLVTNSGNVKLAGPVTITDDKATDEACPNVNTVGNLDSFLDPGESITCTASYTITQADLNAGSVTNTATAHAGGTDSNTDTETVTAVQSPALSLVKTADPTTYDSVGDVISYSYLVTNTGNVSLAGPVTITDDKATDESCPDVSTVGNFDGFLDPGESITCTASYTITQADLDAGSVINTAMASAGGTNSNQDSETVTAIQAPALSLVKTATPSTYDEVGDVINYSYLVTNSGNVKLAGPVTVTDDKATDESCPNVNTVGNFDGFLDPGESITCTASYTITQADLNNGSVTNVAQAHAGGTDSNTDTETVNAVQSPALTLVKTATPATYDSVGDVISYSYLVTNTGNVSLAGPVTITDDKATDEACPNVNTVGNLDGFLDPAESITCTASYTITQADLNAGSVTNVATAHAGGTDSNTDTETVNAIQSPALTLVKTASPTTYDSVGDMISYSYLLTNSGNVTLVAPFTITDDKALDEACPATPTSLAPGNSIICTASYTITQADLDTGEVTNTAQGHGYFGTTPIDSNYDYETVEAVATPALTLVKAASPTTYDSVGDLISYSYELTNSGNVTLVAPFTITDDKALDEACPATPTSLAPGASIICTASYAITQADLDAGVVTNTAIGHGFFGTTPVDSNEDSETVTATQSPALSLVKTADPLTYDSVGDLISYSYLVTNTGNVTLYNISVVDDKATVTCPDTSGGLAPTAQITCAASYTITQADLDFGSVTNTAYATDGTTDSEPDSETVTADQNPALSIVKTADPATYDSVGDVISYSYLVTNTGNVTLYNISVVDDKATVTCPDTSGGLAPTAQITCAASYTITQADLDSGSVTNTAYATDGTTDSEPDSETVTADQNPALSIVKTATPSTYDSVGDVISYSYLVTNSGNVTLYDITVVDDKATVTCPDTSGGLAPTAQITCSASYTITQADLDSGSVTNTAYATDGTTDSEPDSETVDAIQNPGLTVVKTATPSTYDSVGDVISYSYLVTNSGNVTLYDITVVDDKATVTCPDTSGGLAPTAQITCSASYTITQADLDFGSVTNTAYATDGTTDSEPDSETVDAIQNPALSIVKTADPVTYDSVGDVISYSYLVTNTGNVTLYNISVVDDKTTVTCPDTSGGLAPTAQITCAASYTITQADLDTGSVTNTTSATDGTTDSEPDSETVDAIQNPALILVKTADPATYDSVGDVISYNYNLENTGNVTLFGPFTVSDDKATVTCPATATLAPNASIDCTASYTIGQADLDTGEVTNTAQGKGSFNGNDVFSNEDSTTVTADQNPELTLDKTADPATYDSVGDIISYNYNLKNTGNVTLSGPFTVSDDKAIVICPLTVSLAPNASIDCTATYIITQADVDAGSVTNTAQGHAFFNGNPVDSNEDSTTVTADQNPELTLDKTADPTTYDSVGDVISYSYELTNTGNVTLSGPFTVTDDKTTVTCPATASLAPNASITCSATYTITQADLDAGSVTNTAQGKGSFNGNAVFSNEDSTTVDAVQNPSIMVEKFSSLDMTVVPPSSRADVGDVIHYSFTVTNTGNVTLTNVTVTDAVAGVNCTIGTMAPAAVDSTTCTGSYTLTQADIDAGDVHNQAFVTGTDPNNEPVTNDDENDQQIIQAPAIDLVKSGAWVDGDADGFPDAGEVINYTFTVTNTGNVTLTNITVTDTVGGVTVTGGPIASLAPGASDNTTFTGTYTLTQADIDAAHKDNTAEACGDDPNGAPTCHEDDETVTLPQNHALTVEKTANPTSLPEPGGAVTFNVRVNNTGNTTLNLTSLQDNVYGNIADNTNTAINSTTCTVPQTIPVSGFYECTFNADVTGEPGLYTDIVSATANNVTESDDATVEITDVEPTVDLVKDVIPASYPEPGGVFTYTLKITNTSVEDVTIIALTDDNALSAQCVALVGTTLTPGQTVSCTYTVNRTNAGTYPNTATVTVQDNEGNDASDNDSETVTVTDVEPTITLTKTASPTSRPEPGGVFTFTLTITNNSVETVTITTLTDTQSGATDFSACAALISTTLAAGASTSCQYTVTHTDAGSYPNTASVTVQDNEGNSASDDDNETVTVTDVLPTVDLTKTASPTSLTVGQSATFTLTIKNTSVETVTITALTDTNALSAQCLALIGTTLAAGASTSCTYTVTYSSPGSFTNTATVTVRDNENNPASDTATATVTVNKASPTIVTTPNPTSGKLGVVLNDSANLSNGFNPTGTITFKLYDPTQSSCTGTPRFTQTVTVNGNGTYTTTGGFMTDRAGTWRWVATYSGDAKNNTALSGCNAELVQVSYHPGTIGFWKNWRNHYTSNQVQSLINYLKTNNWKIYNKDQVNNTADDLTIQKWDAIFNVGTSTPRDQMILAQFTALKLNLAITQLDGTGGLVQKNDDLCTAGVVNVSSISGATAFFGTATPTVAQIVTAVENRWTGNLTTNRNNWTWNLTNAQKDMIIRVTTGINEGTLVMSSGCP